MKKALSIFAVLLMFSALNVMAQDFCQGDFDDDSDVDADDVTTFLEHFGRSQFNNPCPPDGPAPVPKTGQTTSYATGDDGDYLWGVKFKWPNARFTDNEDGTVTDNLTGLIWLKNANCFGPRTWYNALSDCNGLASGICGLTDGSDAGKWRLPHIKELQSLIDFSHYPISLPSLHPFTNVLTGLYWSSTTFTSLNENAWFVAMFEGSVYYDFKSNDSNFVWPVRGGRQDAIPEGYPCSSTLQCGADYCCCYGSGPGDCNGEPTCCVSRELCEALSTCM
jgi:hypothetical protein